MRKKKTIVPKPFILRALFTAALSYAAGAVHAAPETATIEQAEQQIRLLWQTSPELSYHTQSYRGTLQECLTGRNFVQRVITVQGAWIPTRELPQEMLVFKGARKGYAPGKTLGGVGFFFCNQRSKSPLHLARPCEVGLAIIVAE